MMMVMVLIEITRKFLVQDAIQDMAINILWADPLGGEMFQIIGMRICASTLVTAAASIRLDEQGNAAMLTFGRTCQYQSMERTSDGSTSAGFGEGRGREHCTQELQCCRVMCS